MNKVQIKSVEIEVGKKKFSVTVEEAKKLKSVLDELFGKEIIKEVTELHHHHNHSNPWYYYPPIVDPIPCTPMFPITYCSNGSVEHMPDSTLKITTY